MLRLAVVVALAGCGGTVHTVSEPVDPQVGELAPSADDPLGVHKPAVRDGTFAAAFPGAPLAVRVRALSGTVIAPDQFQDQGRSADRELIGMFSMIGAWTDVDGVKYLVLVSAIPDPRPHRDAEGVAAEQPQWFVQGAQPERGGPWRVWPERDGRGTLLAIERDGEVIAARYEIEVDRVRPLAIDPATPMVLVEISDPEARVAARYQIFGFQDGAVKPLLSVDAARTALAVDATGVHVTVVPEAPMCATTQLASEGCAAQRIDYAWRGGRFSGAARSQRVRLVDVPQ